MLVFDGGYTWTYNSPILENPLKIAGVISPNPPKRYLYRLETVRSSEVGIQFDQMHEIYIYLYLDMLQ